MTELKRSPIEKQSERKHLEDLLDEAPDETSRL
jgi:hypothetical protein